jgi:hypothetical protein
LENKGRREEVKGQEERGQRAGGQEGLDWGNPLITRAKEQGNKSIRANPLITRAKALGNKIVQPSGIITISDSSGGTSDMVTLGFIPGMRPTSHRCRQQPATSPPSHPGPERGQEGRREKRKGGEKEGRRD